jgi:hypothetical protein
MTGTDLVLARIDDAITGRCVTCNTQLRVDGPDPVFCTEGCQRVWYHQRRGYHPLDDEFTAGGVIVHIGVDFSGIAEAMRTITDAMIRTFNRAFDAAALGAALRAPPEEDTTAVPSQYFRRMADALPAATASGWFTTADGHFRWSDWVDQEFDPGRWAHPHPLPIPGHAYHQRRRRRRR